MRNLLHKNLLIAVFYTGFLLFASSSSFAEVTSFNVFDALNGNNISGGTLDWESTPWLEIGTDKLKATIKVKWFWGTDSAPQFSTSVKPDSSYITWASPLDWETIKIGKTGLWTLEAHQNGNPDFFSSFTLNEAPVVPEPISSTLFLLGGAALFIRKLRNRKVQ